uniref:Ankyrin repeat protein n=1 Tax=Trichogramma kaykai TaxID=54128 RepID=A0ABD2X4P1_9HYME
MDYEHLETEYGQVNLLIFKSLRKKVNLEIKEERQEFIYRIYPLINDWKGKYPDLGSIFRPEELDWLLSDSIDLKYLGPNKIQGGQFIELVTRSGYKDKPNIDTNGKPLLQRTTALLHAAKIIISNNTELVSCLFKIYDRYDANYIDERGLTHFHIACRHDFDDIVKKFLEHGLDPNIPVTDEVNTSLNLTIIHERKKCFELLLRNGANPNHADHEGLTPLHRLCDKDISHDWMELFFQINDDIQRTVLVDARDNKGDTPMHTALYDEEIEKFKFLLKRRADPNIANEEGLTPLHIICSRKIDDDLGRYS